MDGHEFSVEVVDTVALYSELMEDIFDFPTIRNLLKGTDGQPSVEVTVNSLHGGKLYFNQ